MNELVIPGSGELVDLSDERQCVKALLAVREFEQQLRAAKAALTEAVVERSRLLGEKTITLSDGLRAEIRGGSEVVYDAQALEADLRALGMPEERLREIIIEEVAYKVSAREAKRAASANPQYAAVVASARHEVEKPHYVVVSRK
jgi:hypothetical protein